MRSTIKDVSERAGVSIKTVSRVLNKERYVGAATREKVEEAVRALNFRPSLAARSLAGRRSFQIGLICDNPSPAYVYAMQTGIRDRCEADGVRMIAQPYDRHSGRLLEEVEALVDTSHLDGLILTPPVSDHDGVLDFLKRRGVRVVRVSPGTRAGASAAVFIDNRAAATEVTRHLLSLGHRSIGHIVGQRDFATSAQRREGYLAALAEAGIAPEPALIEQGDYDFASGAPRQRLYARLRRHADQGHWPSARDTVEADAPVKAARWRASWVWPIVLALMCQTELLSHCAQESMARTTYSAIRNARVHPTSCSGRCRHRKI